MAKPVTVKDLEWALMVIESYEPAPGDDRAHGAMVRVAAFLENKIQSLVLAGVARETGVSVAAIRKAIQAASTAAEP